MFQLHFWVKQLKIVKSIDALYLFASKRKYANMEFLNQARAGHRPACAWFLKIDPERIFGMCACVCVCVHARGY